VVDLLERDGELAAVARLFGTGGVLLVEGGAGVGKTSLSDTACARAGEAGCEVLRARGSELEAAFAFGVVRQLFERRLVGADRGEREVLLAGAAEAAWPLLSGKLGEGPAEDTSFAVLHGLYWLAANLASSRPVVIAVDDAHWADPPSLRWLVYVSGRVEGLALSVLVTLRPAESASGGPSLLALRAEAAAVVCPRLLSQGAVAAIVRGTLGARASDELCMAVARASGGNPFYVRELLRTVELEGDLVVGLEPAGLLARGGEGVARQVAGRVRRLNPEALLLAQALAVLGDGCEIRHAAAVVGLEIQSAGRLAAGLVRLDVLAEGDPPRFLHPIVRDAVEASLGSDARDSLHRAAARLLHMDRAPPGKVAAHLVRVPPTGDSWVLARLRAAARAAVERGAPSAGAELLRRALAEPPSGAERVAVLREAGRAEALAGSETACTRLDEALQLTADPRERAEIALQLAEAYAGVFRWVDAVDVSERALAELGEADQRMAAQLEGELVVAGLRDPRRASRVLPVLERLSSRPLDGAAAEACAVGQGIVALWIEARPAEEVAHPLREVSARAGPRVVNWDIHAPGLWALIHAEGFGAAEDTLGSMRAEVHRSGTARGLYVTYATLGLLKLRLGALPEADAPARVALHVLQTAEFDQGFPLVATVLAEIAIEAGELNHAQTLLDQLPREGVPAMARPRAGACASRRAELQTRSTSSRRVVCSSVPTSGASRCTTAATFMHARGRTGAAAAR
jgi:hypothetical protein